MTSYHGGKQKTGKQIASAIKQTSEEIMNETGIVVEGYCEPFCGMLGVYKHIPKLFQEYNLEYKAGDINQSIIEMWNEARSGWIPPISCSEEEYKYIKSKTSSSALKGFIGHASAFGGQYCGSYKKRNETHLQKQSEKVIRIAEELSMVSFISGSYDMFYDLKNYIIYCDPPYQETENKYYDEYRNNIKFDYDQFIEWCDMMSQKNIIFLSAYNAPRGFNEIWSNSFCPNKIRGRYASGIERLFIKN